MERQVPAIILMAASTVAAFKSGIFISAISCNWAFVIVATFVLFGTPEPDLILQAFLIRTGAGGVFGAHRLFGQGKGAWVDSPERRKVWEYYVYSREGPLRGDRKGTAAAGGCPFVCRGLFRNLSPQSPPLLESSVTFSSISANEGLGLCNGKVW